MVAERDVDVVADRDQPLLKIQRIISGAVREPRVFPLAPTPAADGHLPQVDAVERVARRQKPLVRQIVLAGQTDRRFIDDGE